MTLLSLDVRMEHILSCVLLMLSDQVQCLWTSLLWSISPLYWLWRRLILLPSCLFLNLLLLLLFAVFIFRLWHEFTEEESWQFMLRINLFNLWL
jgi:hypothetical protein